MSIGKLCLILLIFIIPLFLVLPDRFSSEWIVSDVEGDFTPFDCPEIAEITNQPLRYLGHGLQSIAFVSADNRYVLKFFLKRKLHRKIRFGWKRSSPNRIRHDLLQRYDQAFRKMREETGLVAVHLGASSQELPVCTVHFQGHSHFLDLNRASFVVQRYGAPLDKLPFEKTKNALAALLEARAKKGFTDYKERLNLKNFALLGGKAIMIDVGNVVFSEEQKKDPSQELERIKGLFNSH